MLVVVVHVLEDTGETLEVPDLKMNSESLCIDVLSFS